MVNEHLLPRRAAARGLWANPVWRRIWFSQLVSVFGDFVFDTTVVLWVATVIAHGRTWAPIAVGGVVAAQAVPVILIAPIAGVFVDRWRPASVMIRADLIRAALVALLLAIPFLGSNWPVAVQLTLVYAVVGVGSAAAQFFNPARFRLIGEIVAEDDQPRAFGAFTATSSGAAVLGPPLAAPLLFGLGVYWALVVNVVSFLVSFLAIRSARIPAVAGPRPAEPAGWRTEFVEGLTFFVRSRQIRTLAITICVFMFGASAINVLDVFFVTENLHVDASWLGTLMGALGIGGLLGALVTGRIATLLGHTRVFSLGVFAAGLAILVYSRMTSLPAAIVVMTLVGLAEAAVETILGPLVLQATPSHLIGRIGAVVNPLIFLASIVATGIVSLLASTTLRGFHATVAGINVGRIDVVFAGAAVLIMLAGGYAASRIRPPRVVPAVPSDQSSGAASRENVATP